MLHLSINIKEEQMKINEVTRLYEKTIDLSSIISNDLLEIEKLFKANGHDLKIAGGAVRDLILGREPKDIDLATTATPDEMVTMLKGFRTIPTGLQHGTMTVLGKEQGEEFEITTLRIDTNHDGRRADVQFVKDFKQDAARRDLTYNAMFLDLDGTLHDHFGGQDDLSNNVTRSVGDPGERFKEDYLRILRMFRFSARYGHTLDQDTLNAIMDNAEGLKQISGERIWMEISKILAGPDPRIAIEDMASTGVDHEIDFPGTIDTKTWNRIIDVSAFNNAILMLGLLSYSEGYGKFIAEKWKMSSEERDRLVFITTNKNHAISDKEIKAKIAESSKPEWTRDRFVDVLKVQGREFNALEKWSIPTFPVQGQDLINIGMKPGPEMGQTLKALRDSWINSDFTTTHDELITSLGI